MTDMSAMGGDTSPSDLANPQPLFRLLREAGPAVDLAGDADDASVGLEAGSGNGLVVVGGDAEVRHVLASPEIFSSGIDAVAIGQIRPLIPLQIDPPQGDLVRGAESAQHVQAELETGFQGLRHHFGRAGRA